MNYYTCPHCLQTFTGTIACPRCGHLPVREATKEEIQEYREKEMAHVDFTTLLMENEFR